MLTATEQAQVSRGRGVPGEPVVSVCILVVSDHGLIEGCLDSIAASPTSVDTEVVVVANGLADDQLSLLREKEDIVLVRSPVNMGFAGGNNLAARFARGRYLLLLNDDSIVEAGFIDRLLGAFDRDPLLGAAGGTILWPDGTLQEAGSVLWSDGWAAHVGAGFPAESTAYHYVRYVDYLSANGLLLDRRAWDTVGGLDERYFPAYFEDADLCLALWNHGYRVAYEPRARLTHLESQSTSTLFREFLLIRNRAIFVAKWSNVLRDYADHPDPIDSAAMDVAVHSAARSNGRVLVLEDSADVSEWHDVPTIEALAGAGWSVVVSTPVDQPALRLDRGDRAVSDRMVDLGVEVRQEPPEDLLSRYGGDLEAVVVSPRGTEFVPPLQRPDGSSIALIRQRDAPDGSVLAHIAAMAQRRRVESASHDDRPAPRRATGDGPPDHLGVAVEVAAGFGDADSAGLELDFVEAEVQIRREYRDYLESRLMRTRTALVETQGTLAQTDADLRGRTQVLDDTRAYLEEVLAYLEEVLAQLEQTRISLVEKERYIASLPSVRTKKWVSSRLQNRQP